MTTIARKEKQKKCHIYLCFWIQNFLFLKGRDVRTQYGYFYRRLKEKHEEFRKEGSQITRTLDKSNENDFFFFGFLDGKLYLLDDGGGFDEP